MESEILDLSNALRELGLLSAIPLVIYALWGDYFARSFETHRDKDEESFSRLSDLDEEGVDTEIEVLKVRIVGTFVFVFEAVLFLASSKIREFEPFACYLIFVTSVAIQLGLQTDLENKITPSDRIEVEPSENLFVLLGKIALSWIFSAILHISFFLTSVYGAIFLSHYLQLEPIQGS